MDSIISIRWFDGLGNAMKEEATASAVPRSLMLTLILSALPLASLGLIAGLVTTVGGIGGGTLLVVVLTATGDPITALAVTAPALLVGNLHRLYLTREAFPGRSLLPLLSGGLLGAVLGGSLTARLPATVLEVAIFGTTLLAIGGALGHTPRLPAASGFPWGTFVGVLTGTSGGAGLLVNPWLAGQGLTGTAYVAGASAAAVCMHIGRIFAYGVGGLIGATTLGQSLVLTLTIPLGNLIGIALLPHLSPRGQSRLQLSLLIITAMYSLL